jgi:endo-1,4-beta-xylanase
VISLPRRAILTGALALAACTRPAGAQPVDLAPLKATLPFPVGVAAMSGQLEDPAWTGLARRHVSRLTPEWEMKMEAILTSDGGFDWSRADRFVGSAEALGFKIHGHTLIWYAQDAPGFARLKGDRARFAAAYRTYVLAVAGRYAGRLTGWDVVNEPIAEDGSLRDCRWRRSLGDDYVRLAFEHAREADPSARLILNDFDLERRPAKRAGFLRLAERLLKAGAPLQGLGTQTHVPADLEPGAITTTVRELASLGLPIHISELDVSLKGAHGPELERRQAALYHETAQAMAALPERQRYGVTLWGLRDRDSWLRGPAGGHSLLPDRPLLFDDEGRPKAAAGAFARKS